MTCFFELEINGQKAVAEFEDTVEAFNAMKIMWEGFTAAAEKGVALTIRTEARDVEYYRGLKK